jgi:succinate dehydrogenase/fumarate reductase flavoprotein subunit
MSGAGGSGCDHWESAATNPCSGVTPEQLTRAVLDDNDGYNNGISHYIECREGYDRLLDTETMGGKIRDTNDEFKGAAFRDEKTKLLFAYDYKNKITIRVWGTTFKRAMYSELKWLGVKIMDRVMVTSLLTEDGLQGGRCIGATGINTRTGRFYIFQGKAIIMCLSRPARIWLFSSTHTGLCEFRPTQCIGDGHAMGWRAGAEFAMMEKSVRAEFSAAGRSFPPYGAGNNHNTWYGASLIDATGHYAGRHAADFASAVDLTDFERKQVDDEKIRVYTPVHNKPENSTGWKELNQAISKTMQNYCGEIKYEDLLKTGLLKLSEYEKKIVPNTFACNPHELTRLLEVFDILTVSRIIIHASMERKHNSPSLCFYRGDSEHEETENERKLIILKQENDKVLSRELPTDFFGDLRENYEKYNSEYINMNGDGR